MSVATSTAPAYKVKVDTSTKVVVMRFRPIKATAAQLNTIKLVLQDARNDVRHCLGAIESITIEHEWVVIRTKIRTRNNRDRRKRSIRSVTNKITSISNAAMNIHDDVVKTNGSVTRSTVRSRQRATNKRFNRSSYRKQLTPITI